MLLLHILRRMRIFILLFCALLSGTVTGRPTQGILSRIDPNTTISPLTQLSPALLDQIAIRLPDIRDVFSLQSISRTLRASFQSLPTDIRLLYAKILPSARLVSQTNLYNFCVVCHSTLIPTPFPTIKHCFANVDRLDPSYAPVAKLQSLYDFIHAYADYPGPWSIPELLDIFDAQNSFSEPQKRAALYYAAMKSLNTTFDPLFRYFCEHAPLRKLGCEHAEMIRLQMEKTHDHSIDTFILIHEYPEHASLEPSHFLQIDLVLCTYAKLGHVAYQEAALKAIRKGANIHHPCLLDYIYLHFTRKSSKIPFSVDLNHRRNEDSDDGSPHPESPHDAASFLRALIRLGFSVDWTGPQRLPLLCMVEEEELLRLILEAGSSPNLQFFVHFVAPPLIEASFSGRVENVQYLLDYGADIEIRYMRGPSALMAARNGQVARLLLQRGANVEATDDQGNTPAFYAAKLPTTEVLRVLVEEGRANLSACNSFGQTPIMFVQYVAVAKYIEAMDPGSLEHVDFDGETVVHRAVMLPDSIGIPLISHFLSFTHLSINHQDNLGLSPLMKAESTRMLEYLLIQGRANPDLQDARGRTALFLAVAFGRAAKVEVLLRHRADPSVRTAQRETAIGMAYSMVLTNEVGRIRSLLKQYNAS